MGQGDEFKTFYLKKVINYVLSCTQYSHFILKVKYLVPKFRPKVC